jgi:hypothetical protein
LGITTTRHPGYAALAIGLCVAACEESLPPVVLHPPSLSQWVGPRVSREAKKANRDQNPARTVGRGLGSPDSFIVEWGLAAR